MTNEEAKDLMAKRGYSLHSWSGSKLNFTKGVGDYYVIIHAEVNPESNQINLVSIVNLLTISTGVFSLDHPRFKNLFEDKIIKATIALQQEFEE